MFVGRASKLFAIPYIGPVSRTRPRIYLKSTVYEADIRLQ